MSGSFLSRSVERPVRFQDRAGGASVAARLESVRLFLPDDGPRELVLVVWIDYPTYKRIDRGHLFGYSFASLDLADGQAFEVTSAQPIQLELRAEGAALASLAELDGAALLDRAVAGLVGDDDASPLLDVASYKYLGIYQPKEMDGRTFLRGFTSVYRKQA